MLDTSDSVALAIYRRAFPETNFRSLTVRAFRGPMSLNSFWDSGYRDYFVIVPIDGSAPLATVPQNGTPFDGKNLELSQLPEGFAVAVHHYQGSRQRGTLHLNAENLTKFLPAPGGEEMPWGEKVVLAVTSGLKPFARRDEARRMGVSGPEYDAAAAGLKAKRFLNAAGAITNEGRNLVRTFPGCSWSANFHAMTEAAGRKYVW